jgi:signal transduction histidine kinase/DNA-binding response OmpR family regulator
MSTRVLIIEASRTEALRSRLILEREGYQVSLAANGTEGLSKAIEERPDLILLDTIMPHMSGYEVCGRLRLDPRTVGIPIVMLAVEEEQADLPESDEASDHFLLKPYAPPLLVDKVKQVTGAVDRLKVNGVAGSNGSFERLAQTLGVGCVVLREGTIASVDQAAESLFGRQAGELTGKPFVEYLRDDAPPFADMLTRAQAEGQAHGEFKLWVNGSDEAKCWRILAAPTLLDGQTTMQLACLDVTRQKQTEKELQRAKLAAEAANRTRGDFLANMSHELRTPIHELMGMVDLVLASDLEVEQRTYLNTAKTSSNALLTIVSDILEFSEIEAGQFMLEEREADLWTLVESTVEIMAPRAKEKGLLFSAHLAPDTPRTIVGDARRLRQVLVNVIGNAIKFTERGEVTVRARAEAVRDNEVEYHFLVRDTGIGIPEDQRDLIFEPFRQADEAATRRYGGLGLGLAMAQQLVKLMGGRIWVESQVGQGSTFHFTVTFKRPPQALSAPQAARPNVERVIQLQILLAEDSPTNQLIAVSNLKKAGHTVTVANNGLKAVQAFEEKGRRGERSFFDLILMDVAMPEMDGLEATQAIREKEKTLGGHIPIIAMTAFTTKEYHEKCLECGMDAYVSKPVRIDELNKTIEPFLPREPEAPAIVAAPAASPVVEASALSPVVLREALEIVGEDVDILRDAVAISLEEVPGQLQELEDAMARQDANGVEAKAHRLKGVMGNVGAMLAREVGQRLETMGNQSNLAGGPDVLKTFKKEIGRVIAFYSDPAWEQRARECVESG